MQLDDFDKLIKTYFSMSLSSSKLNSLESDVWRQIREKETSSPFNLFSFLSWDSTQLRYASLALIFVVGAMSLQIPTGLVQYDTLGLEIFAAESPYLISSTINLAGLRS